MSSRSSMERNGTDHNPPSSAPTALLAGKEVAKEERAGGQMYLRYAYDLTVLL